MDLRCENGIKFAELDGNVLSVKCRSRLCGAKPGTVVIHEFDTTSGDQLRTRVFRDPAVRGG
jgi:hypothetical protein